MAELVAPFKEGADAVKEAGADTFKLCFQCGLCTTACPWNTVRTFITHRMLRQVQFGLVDFEGDDWWLCTTCGACVMRCPRGVGIADVMEAVRGIMVESGMAAASLRNVAASLGSLGNPWGEEAENRADWAKGLDVKPFTKGTEFLYFPCCTPAYDPNAIDIARATASVLLQTGTDFGILGPKENCCGESIRRAGNDSLFQQLASNNIDVFHENGVEKVIVTSPHCYHTFKNEYGDGRNVRHISQVLAEALESGGLKLTKEVNKKITYHDPCYLGRHNEIYDEPRAVIQAVPGAEFIEMERNRENSLCCGGGGGKIWMEVPAGERLSDFRVQEALDIGAEILVVACPYCLTNFEDSRKVLNAEDKIQIMDLTELVKSAI
jgi:Fe-S oxidoreductase